jgi:hypothetical protein
MSKGNVTDKIFEERIKNFNTITERHIAREIEGCTSWRHFVVHQDRGWLLKAFGQVQVQAEKVRQALANADDRQALDAELEELLSMFEEKRLNFLGDDDT